MISDLDSFDRTILHVPCGSGATLVVSTGYGSVGTTLVLVKILGQWRAGNDIIVLISVETDSGRTPLHVDNVFDGRLVSRSVGDKDKKGFLALAGCHHEASIGSLVESTVGIGELLNKLHGSIRDVKFERTTSSRALGIDVHVEVRVGNCVQTTAVDDFLVDGKVIGGNLFLGGEIKLEQERFTGGGSESTVSELGALVPEELSVRRGFDFGFNVIVGGLGQIVNVKDVKEAVSVRVHPELALWPDAIGVNYTGSAIGKRIETKVKTGTVTGVRKREKY